MQNSFLCLELNPNFHETQLVFLMLYSCFRTLDKSFFSVLFLT